MMVAFLLAATMLSGSAWRAFQDRRIESDLKAATVDETLVSPKITSHQTVPPPAAAAAPAEEGSNAQEEAPASTVLEIEIDKDGSPVIPPGIPEAVAEQLRQTRFSPALHNGKPVATRVPYVVRLSPTARARGSGQNNVTN